MVSAVHLSNPAATPMREAAIMAVSAPSMPAHRVEGFQKSVAARLRAGEPVALLVREQQALAVALANPAFEGAMVKAFMDEINDITKQQQNPYYQYSHESATLQVHGILANRVRDAQGFIALLGQPEFMQKALALAAQPAGEEKEYELPDAKKAEVIRRLVQPNDPDGAEPPVHVAASALGQHIVHMTLANIFRPKAGQLHAPLVDALARSWPEGTGAQLGALATRWLKTRHDPAHSVADGLKETGELYVKAMQQAEAVMAEKSATSSVPNAQVNIPAPAPVKLAAPETLTAGVAV